MRTLNLGILAHVDAGKTSLTERLLYDAGVIDEIGSVDKGSTQTDSLELERQRGITIKSAVVSFVVGDVTINLIDTPGHPDFIAEVERVLSVLDGAVLVISAVEGVQAQSRVLMRALRRLHLPTLLFVNKIDRPEARTDALVSEFAATPLPAVISMGATQRLGTRDATFTPFGDDDAAFTSKLAEIVADHDDLLLAELVERDRPPRPSRLRAALTTQTKRALVCPAYFGSAITGAGVDALTVGINALLPAARGDGDGPVSSTVFKVERGAAGERVAYVRMFSGSLSVRDRVRLRPDAEERTVTGIRVFDRGGTERRGAVIAGEIALVAGLGDVQIGDTVGLPATMPPSYHFAPPTLEAVVVPRRTSHGGALYAALAQLAEQDPLINLRQDDIRREVFVSLYGEVQKEVIGETLLAEYGITVEFRETTTICIERAVGTGAAVEAHLSRRDPFLATVGLRVTPTPVGSGNTFRIEVELGSLPLAFMNAIRDAVHETLRQGLSGWRVTDSVVTLTHAGYSPRQSRAHGTFDKNMSSTAWDFRTLTPLVLTTALRRAGTSVHEPVHRFHLEAPADVLGPLLSALAKLGAIPHSPAIRDATCSVDGRISAAQVHHLRQQLPGLTRGHGLLECEFDSYRPVRGAPPTRPRTDHNPLDRKEYLLRVTKLS